MKAVKVAIPLFKDRVAPHFGASSEILLVEIKSPSQVREVKLEHKADTPYGLACRLVELGVNKLVCGGISKTDKEWFIRRGISVEDNRKGEVRKIINEILDQISS